MAQDSETPEIYLLNNRDDQEKRRFYWALRPRMNLADADQRLNTQHELIIKISGGNLLDPVIPTFPGMKVADIGTGTG
jgi:hypothetical protein